MMTGRTKKLVNAVQDCVDENLEGVVLLNPGLCKLQGHRVILRSDLKDFLQEGKVSILTGGGSGHEPAFAGYVGRGMACAAVQGAIFASPGPSAILAAIRAVARHGKGVIIIVNNYTGDRLNFGVAIERARSEGVRTALVLNSDDCALMTSDKTAGRRGLAGIVLLLKVAGGMSEQGCDFDEILAETRRTTASIGTMGVCLSPCSVPGQGLLFELGAEDMEIGLGLHGEAGIQTVKMMTAHDTVEYMIKHMTDPDNKICINIKPGDEVAVLINNLGSTSDLEMNILAREVILYLEGRGVTVSRAYANRLATSQEMAGISITILRLDDTRKKCLDVDVNVMSWVEPVMLGGRKERQPVPEMEIKGAGVKSNSHRQTPIHGVELSEASRHLVFKCLRAACEALRSAEDELNKLDTKSGDGDCGSTLSSGAQAVLHALGDGDRPCLAVGRPHSLLLDMAGILEEAMGGCSGALYSLFFTAAAQPLEADTGTTAWLAALHSGIEAIKLYGGAEVGDRTMLEALYAAYIVLKDKLPSMDPVQAFAEAVEATEDAAEATTGMVARAGRASYVHPSNLCQADPGAKAVAVWMRAIYTALSTGTVNMLTIE